MSGNPSSIPNDPLWSLSGELTEYGLNIYVQEIGLYARTAKAQLKVLRASEARTSSVQDILDVMQAGSAILTAGASISKFLFPSPGKSDDPTRGARIARGQRLRRELDVPDDSRLRQRRLRNTMEHLDERLDALMTTALPRGDPFATNVILGVPDAIIAAPPMQVRYLRAYTQSTDVLRVLDDELHLDDYLRAIGDLDERCERWATDFHDRWQIPVNDQTSGMAFRSPRRPRRAAQPGRRAT